MNTFFFFMKSNYSAGWEVKNLKFQNNDYPTSYTLWAINQNFCPELASVSNVNFIHSSC